MMFYRIALVVLCCVLVAETAEGKRQRHKQRDSNNNNNNNNKHDDFDPIAHLTNIVEKLSERINQISDEDESSCPGNNLHFFFHGDGDTHDHSDGDHNVHIDLHLNNADHHSDDHDDHDHYDDHHSDDHDHHSEADDNHNEMAAHCGMVGTSGFVHIVQGDHEKTANFMFDFDNLGEAHISHMVHVHEFGDMSDGCKRLGSHYNPYISEHDVGDLKTVETDSDGAIIETWNNDTMLTLFGKYSIMGRGIIIHNTDRSPLACCVIGFSSDNDELGHGHGHGHGGHGGHGP